jgi:hypothetical protein
MSTSLTYQEMPPWLLDPLMAQAISLAEAAELWDEWLMMGEPDRWTPDCPRLQQAAMRIRLLDQPPETPALH